MTSYASARLRSTVPGDRDTRSFISSLCDGKDGTQCKWRAGSFCSCFGVDLRVLNGNYYERSSLCEEQMSVPEIELGGSD